MKGSIHLTATIKVILGRVREEAVVVSKQHPTIVGTVTTIRTRTIGSSNLCNSTKRIEKPTPGEHPEQALEKVFSHPARTSTLLNNATRFHV